MRLVTVADYAAVSEAAAEIAMEQLRSKPQSVFGLPTGNTPVGFYRRWAESSPDLSRATFFNLDDYVGLPPDHPSSFHTFMQTSLLTYVNLPAERWHIPNGLAADLKAECSRYERLIEAAGGIDLLYLGLGTNGHIAFNEPGTSFSTPTHIIQLSPETIAANAGAFSSRETVPRHGITIGIGTILAARRIVVLVSGAGKAEILAQSLEGPVTEQVPATALRSHPDVTWLVDHAAAARLQRVGA